MMARRWVQEGFDLANQGHRGRYQFSNAQSKLIKTMKNGAKEDVV